MARGGVTHTEVADARQRILHRGENPSIDAIRAELGHTGSKTTISRHLKTIEQRETARLNDEALLSQPIKHLISQLAEQLQQEAANTVEQAEQDHQSKISNLKQQLKALSEAQAVWQAEKTALQNQVCTLDAETIELGRRQKELQQENAVLNQSAIESDKLLQEKQQQIDSLEDKHRHNREAMAHYRASVKEQREQDQQHHETQVQQIRAEHRQLQQSMVLKQEELTKITGENTRLFTQLTEARKQVENVRAELRAEQREHRQISESRFKLESELETSRDKLSRCQEKATQVDELAGHIQRLEMELSIKNELLIQVTQKARKSNKDNQVD